MTNLENEKRRSILTAVFTRNRSEYLSNCIKSLDSMFPESDLVVFDDDSTHQNQLTMLDQLEAADIRVVRVTRDPNKSRHGTLYRNMNLALQMATQLQYAYVQLVQDDMQIVMQDSDLKGRIHRVFERNQSTFHIGNVFAGKITYSSANAKKLFVWEGDTESSHIKP